MFTIALSNVLLTLVYILPGFILCKLGKARPEHLSTLSAVLIYVGSPCMIMSSFLKMDYTPAALASMGLFFLISLVLQAAFMALLWLLAGKRRGENKYKMLTVGSVMGNVGFFGLPIIKALLPDHPEVMSYSAAYVLSMNMLVFTVGVYFLTGNKKYMSLRPSILNPTTLTTFVALPLYILGAGQFLERSGLAIVTDAVDLIGRMTTPLCMIILGIRLASVPFGSLFRRPFVYLTAGCKLVAYPLFCYGAVYFLPLSLPFKAGILILSAVPCASIVLNLAELYRSETELAANNILLSTLVCFLTIPLLVLLL